MGFLNLFSKRKNKKPAKSNDVQYESEPKQNSFVLGARKCFPIKDSENVFVYGKVQGTVTVGDAVYVSNFGDDDADTLISIVEAIKEDNGKIAKTASNCIVSILFENIKKIPIKCGTVLFTRETTVANIHDAYLDALTNVYVPNLDLFYKPEDAEKLSLSDCQEILRFYTVHKKETQNVERIKSNQAAEASFVSLLIKKLLTAKSIYCVHNKRTNEPHLFTQIFRQEDGSFYCTKPNIMLITKAFHDFLIRKFSEEHYDVREINNDHDGEIESFLGKTFYLNGACGVTINLSEVVIKAEKIVARPDFSEIAEISRPVMNPDLMRWILLLGQIDSVDSEIDNALMGFYSSMIARELPKAKLLIPMRYKGEFTREDETGKAVFKKGGEMYFSIIEGKNDRQAIRMYTDWKRFNESMGSDWSGLIQTVDGVIGVFDCVINVSEHGNVGLYISKEIFEEMKQRGFVT